eukprot:CAMPEP_0171913926 /NCGR_PEP_ID=MMETSP0993-20121228/12176_1 /TAXON_ID=483369 /ORGANISM="non described non described, Strain CCMP2098" /LENGTH=286 /DNA_ID=CAMNT_0012548107 /DNA_START=28 /DNA_END=888 /DNA_ORIENTATION=-
MAEETMAEAPAVDILSIPDVMEATIDDEDAAGSYMGFVIAFLIVIATMVFILIKQNEGDDVSSIAAGTAKQKVDGVVLLGPSGGGKTVILHKLCSAKTVDTLPSMMPSYNQVVVGDSGSKIQVVDFPGHERLRASMLQHVKSAKGVVFVLDATSVRAIKQAAHLLFHLLTSNEYSSSTPLLVFCNKADQKEAKGSERVKMLLQKEIEGMCKTSAKMPIAGSDDGDGDELGSSSSSSSSLGALAGYAEAGKPFKFDDTGSVTFASGSAIDSEASGGLKAVVGFLRAC